MPCPTCDQAAPRHHEMAGCLQCYGALSMASLGGYPWQGPDCFLHDPSAAALIIKPTDWLTPVPYSQQHLNGCIQYHACILASTLLHSLASQCSSSCMPAAYSAFDHRFNHLFYESPVAIQYHECVSCPAFTA